MMRIILEDEDITVLRALEAFSVPHRVATFAFDAEILGLVEGSYQGKVGGGTGGGSMRKYRLTEQGRAFLERLRDLQ